MFMMPMPPTSSEMPTMPPMTTVTLFRIRFERVLELIGRLHAEIVLVRPCRDCARAQAAAPMVWLTFSSSLEIADRQPIPCRARAGCPEGSLIVVNGMMSWLSWLWPKISPFASSSPMIFSHSPLIG